MLQITSTVAIPLNEIEMTQIHSSGPGGQNVNKVANSIHLRFPIATSSLPDAWRTKLLAVRDRRISKDGVIVIKAQRFRSTDKNREDALNRLQALITSIIDDRKKRIPTRPTTAAKRRRLTGKQRRSDQKIMRRKVSQDD